MWDLLVSIVSILQISPNLAAAGALVYLLQGGARRSPGILRCVAFGLPQIHQNLDEKWYRVTENLRFLLGLKYFRPAGVTWGLGGLGPMLRVG